MKLRERVLIIDEIQASKRDKKYSNWRKGKRNKHYTKFIVTQPKYNNWRKGT